MRLRWRPLTNEKFLIVLCDDLTARSPGTLALVNDCTVAKNKVFGGNGMPSYADLLSEAEKANVIAYLKTL